MSRGLANNNPGNIRRSATKYMGEADSTDPAFKRFETVAWGYRAMFVLLHTYRTKYGLRTLRGMIDRYAPPGENDTARYVDFVASKAAVGADEDIDTRSRGLMVAVVGAMSRMENGVGPCGADVEAGWDLFVAHKP